MNRLAQSLRILREVFANAELRRLELAWGGFYLGEWALVVTLFVIAFNAGGVVAVGLVSVLRTLPPAFVVPFSAGGSNDVIARAIAAPLSARLGVPVIGVARSAWDLASRLGRAGRR